MTLSYGKIISLLGLMVLSGLVAISGYAADDSSVFISKWGATLDQDARLISEMGRFKGSNQRRLSEEYRKALASRIRSRVFSEAQGKLEEINSGGCKAGVRVQYLDSGFERIPGTTKEQKEFEGGFVRVEATGCFDHGTIQRAFEIMSTGEFRKASSELVVSSVRNGNTTCEETKGKVMIIGPTKSCMESVQLSEKGLIVNYAHVTWNADGSELQPIFYKESVTVFTETKVGIGVHAILYARATEVSDVLRRVGAMVLESSQKKAFERLNSELR